MGNMGIVVLVPLQNGVSTHYCPAGLGSWGPGWFWGTQKTIEDSGKPLNTMVNLKKNMKNIINNQGV